MKLISMTDFVLEQEQKKRNGSSVFKETIFQYANFLKQPLKLEMFVPCDENGNYWKFPPTQEEWEWAEKDSTEAEQSFKQKEFYYQKAKEKVLFEGFECIKECDDYLCLTHENITIYYNIEEQLFILDDNDDTMLAYIECLCNYNNYTYRFTTLTQNATKQFL